ncbi:MAG: potassium channel family protein, partial [Candidatus Bathyarchaeia archaeon]
MRELLIEMKNISELMVDLAYSAVLFNDYELAEEVVELEDRIDDLRNLLLMNAAMAVRDKEDAESMVGIIRTASAADKISDAAGDIAHIVLRRLGVDSYILEALTKVDERLVRTRVLLGSPLMGKALKELELETKIGVDIIAIRRGKQLVVGP